MSARDTAECDKDMKMNYSGLGITSMHALSPASSVDGRHRSWYVVATTPIDSTVGSRPPRRAVSVFVWE